MSDDTETGPGTPAGANSDGTSERSTGLTRGPIILDVPLPVRKAYLVGGMVQPGWLPGFLEHTSHVGGEEAEAAVHLATEAAHHPVAAVLAGAGAGVAFVVIRKLAYDQKPSAAESPSSAPLRYGLGVTYPGSPYIAVFFQGPMQLAKSEQLDPDLQKKLLDGMARSVGKDTNEVADPVGAVLSEMHRRRAEHPEEPDQ
jgi:hypothetical protein